MTQIDFYTHVTDKYQLVCALSAKTIARGTRMMIYTPDALTGSTIDNLLWTASPIGFIPHCRADEPIANQTPILIDHKGTELPHDEILLNLHPDWPPFFSRFKRLIEVVGTEESDKSQARERYRFYRDRGYQINSHDLSKFSS